MSLTTSYAHAQSKPASQPSSANDVKKLRAALSQALDIIEDREQKLKAANELITATQEEREAARDALAKAQRERESIERSLKYAETALTAQGNALNTYEKVIVPNFEKIIATQGALNDKLLARADKLEDKLDKANSRTVKAGFGGFVLGIIAKMKFLL